MIRTSNTLLKSKAINPYASISYATQMYSPLQPNCLRNSSFLIWQYFTEKKTTEGINISEITDKDGFFADAWYIDNLTGCAQSMVLKKSTSLFEPLRNVAYSININGGDQLKASTGLTTSLSQNILSYKIANLINSNHSLGVSFYVRSSIVGKFCVTLTLFNRNENLKYTKILSYYINQANTTQKVTLWFGALNFEGLYPIDYSNTIATIDFILSGSSDSVDTNWRTVDIQDSVIKCLQGQKNLFTGNNDYIEFSNLGVQACEIGYSMTPELNVVNLSSDYEEALKNFERVTESNVDIFPVSSDASHTYWTATVKMHSIKYTNSLVFRLLGNSNTLSCITTSGIQTIDVSDVSNFARVTNENDRYSFTFQVTSSKISTSNVLSASLDYIDVIAYIKT